MNTENQMNIAVVTGASSGMGKEFAKALDKTGAYQQIWVIARRKERLDLLAAELKTPVRVIGLDLTDPVSFKDYASLLENERPNVVTLVNCSGFGKFGTYADIPLCESLNMIDLNCKAVVQMTELTLPYMSKGSDIVNLDSLSSFQPVPYLNVYAATKAFVLSYSRALNRELSPRGIRVMAVCPGWVRTEFFDRATVTDEKAVTYFNVTYSPEQVIATAMKDRAKKKDVSVHGLPVKMQVLLVKLLPHRFVMNTWLRQQKHRDCLK